MWQKLSKMYVQKNHQSLIFIILVFVFIFTDIRMLNFFHIGIISILINYFKLLLFVVKIHSQIIDLSKY